MGIKIEYLLSPIELIPDFMPVVGLLDDLIIILVLIRVSLKLIPVAVWMDAREKVSNNPAS